MAKLEFSGQHADEAVLFVFRRHIISMRKGFYGLLISFCVGSIPFLIWSSNTQLLWGSLGGLIIGSFICFYQWIGWRFSVFIVTNERIRQLIQKSFFGHSVIDLNLAKVQNISYRIPGFTGEIFNFGTIVLQTIVGDMVIDKVSHCERVYNALADAIHDAGGGGDQLNDPATINVKEKENNEQS
ncbi:PH domain-containing protein [Candidatus Saccharibacteria bacterium]|nr:PH domain-containing protein [Candidatus Saccharibacteria bacterium]